MEKDMSSVHNPLVKQWAELLGKKGRDKQGKYLIEGIHLVQEALTSGAQVECLIYDAEKGLPAEIEHLLEQNPLNVFAANGPILSKITDTVTPQGICAVVRKIAFTISEAANSEWSLAVLVDGVQDPGNLGTLIRSADAVKADAVIVGMGSVDIYSPKTIRATMGSLFHLPVVECDLRELFAFMRNSTQDRRPRLISTSLQADASCYDVDFRRPTWLVVGNEAHGVSEETARHVDQLIKIPMPGKAESLNVAMAATVLLFEAMRQRLYPTHINA